MRPGWATIKARGLHGASVELGLIEPFALQAAVVPRCNELQQALDLDRYAHIQATPGIRTFMRLAMKREVLFWCSEGRSQNSVAQRNSGCHGYVSAKITSAAQRTTDHQAIRKWIEKRGGRPARV